MVARRVQRSPRERVRHRAIDDDPATPASHGFHSAVATRYSSPVGESSGPNSGFSLSARQSGCQDPTARRTIYRKTVFTEPYRQFHIWGRYAATGHRRPERVGFTHLPIFLSGNRIRRGASSGKFTESCDISSSGWVILTGAAGATTASGAERTSGHADRPTRYRSRSQKTPGKLWSICGDLRMDGRDLPSYIS